MHEVVRSVMYATPPGRPFVHAVSQWVETTLQIVLVEDAGVYATGHVGEASRPDHSLNMLRKDCTHPAIPSRTLRLLCLTFELPCVVLSAQDDRSPIRMRRGGGI